MARLEESRSMWLWSSAFTPFLIAAVSASAVSRAHAGPQAARSRPAPRAVEPASPRAIIRFGDDLGTGDIRLAGGGDARRVSFACESSWKMQPGSELHLLLEHSPALDPDRSFLSVTLNGGILRSLRLDETNQATEVVIPLRPGMLRGANELALSAVQVGRAGEPEAAAWTRIRAGSFVSLAYTGQDTRLSLQSLPLPLLDPASYRPLALSIVLPTQPSPDTLEATGLVVGYLAMKLAPKPLRIAFLRSLADADRPALAVGTPIEQPQLAERLTATELKIERQGSRVTLRAGGATLEPATGVIGLIGGSGSRPLLVVTAESPAGVLRAGRALAGGDADLRAPVAVVRGELARRQAQPREWKGHIPPRSRFTLSDLGYGDGQLVLTGDAPLRIDLRATPDSRFLARAHSLTLSLALLPALFEARGASVDVAWNGVTLASYPVAQLEEGWFSASVSLPAQLLRRENELTLACRGSDEITRASLATLSPETAFYLPRAFTATLPDLALLQSSLYPFSLRADLSDLVVLFPDGPRDALFPLVCEMTALLGRLAPGDRLAFHLRQPKGLTSAERQTAHLLVLEAGGAPVVPGPLLDWQRLPSGPELRRLPMLQELVSPWNPMRFVLRLAAKDSDALLRAVKRLAEPEILTHLMGDTAFLGNDIPVCYLVGTQREFDEVSYATLVEAWLQSHWLALPLIVALVSGGIYLALRAALRQHRTAHLASSKGAS